jgi:cystathionine beta-synthase/cysteine synthase A
MAVNASDALTVSPMLHFGWFVGHGFGVPESAPAGPTAAPAFLMERSAGQVEVIAADPFGSVYSGGHPGPILVDGVGNTGPGADWPKVFDRSAVDRFLRIPNDEVYTTARRRLEEEGSNYLSKAFNPVWLAENHIHLTGAAGDE